MATRYRRPTTLVVAAVLLAAFVPAVHSAPLSVCINQVKGLNDRCELWSRSFNDRSPDGSPVSDTPAGAVVNRRGDRLYVATTTYVGASTLPHATVAALSTVNGGTVWLAHSPTQLGTAATALALSPNESLLVVTGTVDYQPNLNAKVLEYWLTTAYSTSNGRQAWSAVYRVGGETNQPVAMAIDAQRGEVIVTGNSQYSGGFQRPYIEWVTIAYSLRTGRQLWLTRYGGLAGGQNSPAGIALSPSGNAVYVAGTSEHLETTGVHVYDQAVIRYDARTGRQNWLTVTHIGSDHQPAGIAISPRNDMVFVVGTATFGTSTSPVIEPLIVAYATAHGQTRWVSRNGTVTPAGWAVSPRGDRLYLVGAGSGGFAATALDTRNGYGLWLSTYSPTGYSATGGESALATTGAVNASGTMLYVGGLIGPVAAAAGYPALVAFTSGGQEAWVARYDVRDPTSVGPLGSVMPVATTVDATGHRVYLSIADQPNQVSTNQCPLERSAGLTQQQCGGTGESDLIRAYAG